jgi:hypothetical protein
MRSLAADVKKIGFREMKSGIGRFDGASGDDRREMINDSGR